MKIFMLRHAHSVGNEREIIDSTDEKFDLGLSEKGKQQAKKLVPKLRTYHFDFFIVSPLTRTIETIKPYLEAELSTGVFTSGSLRRTCDVESAASEQTDPSEASMPPVY